MINIKIITTEPFPIGLAATNRILTYLKGFTENNCQSSVICVRPTELATKAYNFQKSGIFNGVHFSYSCGTPIKSNIIIIRKLQYLKGIFNISLRLLFEKRRNRTNAIIYYSSITSNAVVLYIVTRIKKIVFIKEESEIPIVYIKNMGYIKSWFFMNLHYFLFDGYLVMTKRIIEYLNNVIKTKQPYIQIPMTVDSERFVNIPKSSQPRYMAYCGVLNNQKDGVDLLIKAFINISNNIDDIYLYLIGESATKEEFEIYKSMVHEAHLEKKVIFIGRVTSDKIPEYLCNSSLLVLPRPLNIQSEGGFPTKLAEYLLTGNPVIVTKVGEIPEILTDNKNAFLAEPGSIDSIVEKAKIIFSNYENARIVGAKGKELAINIFDPKLQTRKILDFINSLNNTDHVE